MPWSAHRREVQEEPAEYNLGQQLGVEEYFVVHLVRDLYGVLVHQLIVRRLTRRSNTFI